MDNTDSSDQYAAFADVYREGENLPLRRYAEIPTFLRVLGDIDDLDVLDLACGSGLYTHLLASRGARRVVGVDISASMLAAARSRTHAHVDRVEYLNHDVATMPTIGLFDVVTAVFLFNYAQSRSSLAAMCQRVADHLKPGGRFIGSVPNSHYDPGRPFDDRYQINITWNTEMKDGDEFTFDLNLSRTLQIRSYYWTIETYESTLNRAGLVDVRTDPWSPNDEGLRIFSENFWEPWMDNPFNVVISAIKPSSARSEL